MAYLRLSPRKENEERFGLDAQRTQIRDWAKARGVKVVAWFEDVDVSGTTAWDARPGLQEALAALRSLDAGVLVTAKRDRLARDVRVMGRIKDQLDKHRAVFLSADGMGGSSAQASPGEWFAGHVIDGVSQIEHAQIKERTRAALAVKIDRGEMTGKPPYGYRAVPHPDRKNKRGHPLLLLEPHEDEQRVIAFAIHLHEMYSLRQVAEKLTEMGLRSRAGTPFSHVQVGKMIRRAEAKS